MKWIRERDALIAQTLAFVQSVTGRKDDFGQPGTFAAAPASTIELAALVATARAVEITEGPLTEPPRPSPPPQPLRTAAQTAPQQASEPVSQPASNVAPPRATGEFRSEIEARVASFRRHQQRFEREREEYCAATLARARATTRGPAPPPAAGK